MIAALGAATHTTVTAFSAHCPVCGRPGWSAKSGATAARSQYLATARLAPGPAPAVVRRQCAKRNGQEGLHHLFIHKVSSAAPRSR